MSRSRLSNLVSHLVSTRTDEPTPTPASAVSPIASTSSARRKAALLEYFANPSAKMREMRTAWEAAVALYGDEDSDAWMAALEDGSHPLCRVGALARLA